MVLRILWAYLIVRTSRGVVMVVRFSGNLSCPDREQTFGQAREKERSMILITGASGTVGREVLNEVARTGLPHRAMYRSKEDAAKAPSGTETVIADFADKSSLAAALRGVESVYLVCSPV